MRPETVEFVKNSTVPITSAKLQAKQESPPAWTQEACRPPCSEYSFCSGWGVPYLGLPWQGTPHRVPPGRVPLPSPPQGTPQLDLAGYPPSPGWTWQGTPPPGVCPMAFWEMLQSIMGTPPGVNKLTKWNYYLPVVLRTRAVKTTWQLFGPLKMNTLERHERPQSPVNPLISRMQAK